MPFIDVSLVAGRPPEVREQLIRELTDVAERVLGAPRSTIRVVLREVPPENWGVAGVPKSGSSQGP